MQGVKGDVERRDRATGTILDQGIAQESPAQGALRDISRPIPILVVLTLLGLGLRFLNLDAKVMWLDEWLTVMFSLGHTFDIFPQHQLVPLDSFLQLGLIDNTKSPGDVLNVLKTVSTHPPLYFWISHFWIHLWQQPGEMVSIWVGRSLSALFGV